MIEDPLPYPMYNFIRHLKGLFHFSYTLEFSLPSPQANIEVIEAGDAVSQEDLKNSELFR